MSWAKLLTGKEMAEVDRRTIAAGTPGEVLMERAGAAVFAVLMEWFGDVRGLEVVVVCGTGNNGGDGFVVARRLHAVHARITVLLAGERSQVRGDAAVHAARLEDAGVPIMPLDTRTEERLPAALSRAGLVVDALLGTGLTGEPRPTAARIIRHMASASCPVLAVDLPSGVVADNGAVPGPGVKAAVTVTFGAPKIGQLFYPGRSHCGVLRVVDIGLDAAAIQASPSRQYLLDGDGIAALLPRRADDAHKGVCGTAVLIAGSVGMTGAAALSAEAAMRSGVGKVLLGVACSLNDILEAKVTEAMTRPLPEVRRWRCLALRAVGPILDLLSTADAAAVGPGLGRHRETGELVRRLLVRTPLPLVVDADALYALKDAVQLLGQRPGPTVLTPHLGEFARISGLDAAVIARDLRSVASRFATENGVVLVLKGAPTLIACPDGRLLVNSTGNAGMATAGSGDVLTGLITGLLAQGLSPEDAAATGVYLHGMAGDVARETLGEWCMIAGDVALAVPRAMLRLTRKEGAQPTGGLSSREQPTSCFFCEQAIQRPGGTLFGNAAYLAAAKSG